MTKTFHSTARGWVDGSSQTLAAQAFRAAATFVSLPYSAVVRLRNRLFDRNVLRVSPPPRPTIAVGNLTLGGVGKTPFVGWLAEYFLQSAQTPAFISRGYQADRQRELFARVDEASQLASTSAAAPALPDADEAHFAQFLHFNDEARELALRFPATPHFLGSDRNAVAAALVEARPDVDVLLLDDAFQHRRIGRDLDVVVLDALNPFGGGRVFPSGFLREPISGLSRADVVLLNRADLVSIERRQAIRAQVERFAPTALFAEIAQIPRFIFSRPGQSASDALPLRRADASTDASRPIPLNASTAASPSILSNASTAASHPIPPTNPTFLNSPTHPTASVRLPSPSDVPVSAFLPSDLAAPIPSNARPLPFAPPSPPFLLREDFATWAASRRGGRHLAFCGLGSPTGFRKTLETNGLAATSFLAFPDHRAYSAADFATLEAEAERIDAEAILTTTKDFVKWSVPTLAGRPIFALGIGVEFLSGEGALRALLAERFPTRRPQNR